MSKLSLAEQIERVLYTKEGDKYDHRQDPRDVTGLCEADHALRQDLLQRGYVVRWAIDGRYRLTDAGFKEFERRKAMASLARKQGDVRPFEEDWKDQRARDAQLVHETEEDKRKRSLQGINLKEHDNGNNS